MRKGHDGAREEHQRAASIKRASVSWADEETSVPDVLQPDVFDSEEPDSTAFITTGLRQLIISDETGMIIDWPWETGPTGRRTGGKRRRHRLDDVICRGLFHAYAKGGTTFAIFGWVASVPRSAIRRTRVSTGLCENPLICRTDEHHGRVV